MNIEEMLGKCKLREPSAGLKARIALATKDEWNKPCITIEFRHSLWQVAIGLAASFMLVLTGIAVNSKLTSVGESQRAVASMESSFNTDPEIDALCLARLNIRKGARQSVDIKGLIKRYEIVDEELRKGG